MSDGFELKRDVSVIYVLEIKYTFDMEIYCFCSEIIKIIEDLIYDF